MGNDTVSCMLRRTSLAKVKPLHKLMQRDPQRLVAGRDVINKGIQTGLVIARLEVE